jgi:hypothetical protein
MSRVLAGLAAVSIGVVPAAAWASSLPKVDFGTQPSVGLGINVNSAFTTGGSVSIDVPFWDVFQVGGAIATRLDGSVNYDVRAMYRFIEGGKDGPSIAGIIGVWGAPGQSGFTLPGSVAPLVGFGLAYPAMDKLNLRLNLAYSPFFNYTSEFLTFIGGPSVAGAEVAYELTPNTEVTLGINGRGDFVGANLHF